MRSIHLLHTLRQDDGMTTAEYAIGTIAAAGLGSVLLKLLTSDEMKAIVWSLLEKAFSVLFG